MLPIIQAHLAIKRLLPMQMDKKEGKPLLSKRNQSFSHGSSDQKKKRSRQRGVEAMEALSLPVTSYKEEILSSIKRFATTIIVGETGSGKSTQIPQYIIDSDQSIRLVCTQPRRVAAVTVAQRVAQERQCTIGEEVGYSIRFEDCSSSKTRVKYATDGVLLREIMLNPELDKYSTIILDEAHERSLQTDILMGLLRLLQERRPDLKVVVMSATLQVETFMSFFKVFILYANLLFSVDSDHAYFVEC
jgi:HrpA-like RNA helicase